MSDTITRIIVSIGAIAVLVIVFLVSCLILRSCDKTEYNNGACQVCGGHLEYEQAVGHQYGTTYMYKCENCGKRIELYYTPD